MERNLDLFTGAVRAKPKKVSVGSKVSKRRNARCQLISGVCYHCGKTFSELDCDAAVPLLAGWLHYRCYIEHTQLQLAVAQQAAALQKMVA